MSESKIPSQIHFPQLKRVVLQRFSLFTQCSEIELNIKPGVLCLAGANGIGKSTFLAAVNFGITGIVPVVNRGFMSAVEYYKEGVRFVPEYFEGRIVENDRDSAQVAVEFIISNCIFQLTRSVLKQRLCVP